VIRHLLRGYMNRQLLKLVYFKRIAKDDYFDAVEIGWSLDEQKRQEKKHTLKHPI
jgi:hypothetical protein